MPGLAVVFDLNSLVLKALVEVMPILLGIARIVQRKKRKEMRIKQDPKQN